MVRFATIITFAAVVIVTLATSDAATRVVRSPQFAGGYSQANAQASAQAGSFGGGLQPRPQGPPPAGFQRPGLGQGGFGYQGGFQRPGFVQGGFGNQGGFRRPGVSSPNGLGGGGSISISKSISISRGGDTSSSASSNAGSFGK